LLQLNESLEALGPDAGDHHVSSLAKLVNGMAPLTRDVKFEKPSPLHSVKDTEEQEEVEKDG